MRSLICIYVSRGVKGISGNLKIVSHCMLESGKVREKSGKKHYNGGSVM